MMKDLKVTYVSHACLKIEGEFGKLLCDPWFLNEPVYGYVLWKFPAAVIPPEELLKDVDYLYITHSHEDHFHVPSIDRIPRDVKVILAEYAHHPCLRAQTIERVMRAMGFHDITKMMPWESLALGAETTLTVVPSAKSRDHDWENSGFVIDHPGCRLINMNDNVDDEELCEDIHARFDRFDIGFIQTAGVTVFPANYLMPMEEKERVAKERKKEQFFTLQQRLIEMLKLDRVVPFAGDFGWLEDRYFSGNWLGRGSPTVLEDFINATYPGVDVATLYPSDEWSMRTGVVRNHPEIDWTDYLPAVRRVQEKFRPKVEHYAQWIEDSDRTLLADRSRKHTANVRKWITQRHIEFDARFRVQVEGEHSDFAFVVGANPTAGFELDWSDEGPVDQTVHVPERIWASILEGKIMWNMYQWTTQIEEHVPYRLDIGRFWYWLEYNVDLGNKNSQAIIEPRLYPGMQHPTIRPGHGVLRLEDEWDLPWMNDAPRVWRASG